MQKNSNISNHLAVYDGRMDDDVNTYESAHENTADSGCFGAIKVVQIWGLILS